MDQRTMETTTMMMMKTMIKIGGRGMDVDAPVGEWEWLPAPMPSCGLSHVECDSVKTCIHA